MQGIDLTFVFALSEISIFHNVARVVLMRVIRTFDHGVDLSPNHNWGQPLVQAMFSITVYLVEDPLPVVFHEIIVINFKAKYSVELLIILPF